MRGMKEIFTSYTIIVITGFYSWYYYISLSFFLFFPILFETFLKEILRIRGRKRIDIELVVSVKSTVCMMNIQRL